jgi:ribose transport system ATP-binding protein
MLELVEISKSFPGVLAVDNVSARFEEGEIHALLGENGAGKSTVMNIICGVYQPDEGKTLLDGREIRLKSYSDAIDNRISIVNQEIQVVPECTVAENIMLDKLTKFTQGSRIRWKPLYAEAERYLRMVGLDVPARSKTYKLSAANKQLCQIAKALSSDAKYLLLDEPTSSLTMHEAENLFALLKELRDKGIVIIFVTHKIEEALSICDKVTVLRDGKYVGTKECAGLTKQEIVRMMIGREAEDVYLGELESKTGEKVLEVKELCQTGHFDGVNFDLYKGEILGFYGLVGSGRTELAKVIIGEDPYDGGEIRIKGQKARVGSVADCLDKYGLGYVTENRKEEGLILDFSIQENVAITVWDRLKNRITGFLSKKKTARVALDMSRSLDIKSTGISQRVQNLSGGNQQKVCISKWLAADCDILIIDEPTVGVDVGAKKQIHDIIWNLASRQGKSIILISSDMTEMITLARRILVFKESRIVAELDGLDQYKGVYSVISKKIGECLA